MKSTKLTIGKYVTLSLLAMGLVMAGCKKEEKEEPKKDPVSTQPSFNHVMKKIPYILKYTGETCYYCGDWGWPLWNGASDDNAGNALAFANYGSGYSSSYFRNQEINSSFSTQQDIQNNLNGSWGKPSFVMNGSKMTLAGSTIQDAINGITAEVNAINADTDIPATAAFNVTWEGDKIKVAAQAKFHKQLAGTYHMSAYVIENKAKGPQSGPNGGSSVEHHYVMRGSLASDTWGPELFSGSTDAGSTYEKNFEATIPSTYVKSNLYVGIIIWRKNGSKYYWINCATNQ